MSLDVAAFLTARYDEREAAAGEPRTWTVEHHVCHHLCEQPCEEAAKCAAGQCWDCRVDGSDGMIIYDEGGHDAADAAHIARYDPAWALADIGVKRKLLAEHARAAWFENAAPRFWKGMTADQKTTALAKASCARCHSVIGDAREDEDRCALFDYPCPTVRLLASEFAGHPDYREEWRP